MMNLHLSSLEKTIAQILGLSFGAPNPSRPTELLCCKSLVHIPFTSSVLDAT